MSALRHGSLEGRKEPNWSYLAPDMVIYEFQAEPTHRDASRPGDDRPVSCKPYGGNCLGSGCIHWMPMPSASVYGEQRGTCGPLRKNEPIHRREAQRKAARLFAWAVTAPDPVNANLHLARAAAWMRASFKAPLREYDKPITEARRRRG